MRVLIVARTKMKGRRCIGGLGPNGESLRLLTSEGHHWERPPFKIGDVHEVDFEPVTNLTPPHVEDVLVAQGGHRFVS